MMALFEVFFGLLEDGFFDFHVLILVGVEYLTAVETLDVFDVLFTRYHAYFWMFAGDVHQGSMGKCGVLGKIVPAAFHLSNVFLRFSWKKSTLPG
jgi:hypothetical protein